MHLTQPDVTPNPQDVPDPAPSTQDAPDAAPNTQDASWRQTTPSWDKRRVPPLLLSDFGHPGHNTFHSLKLLHLLQGGFYCSNKQAKSHPSLRPASCAQATPDSSMGNCPSRLRTYLIPLCSWRRAQQYPAIRSRIGEVVVEESAIEFWDRQHPIPFSPVTSWIKIAEGWILDCCVAGAEPNNLPQSDSGLVQRSWRNLPSSSGIPRVPIKTTPRMVSDFMSLDATEASFIPLRRWRRAQQSPAIGSRIGSVLVEESAIEFWDRQHPTPFSPVTSWIIALSGWILYRWIAGIEPSLRLSAEKPPGTMLDLRVLWLSLAFRLEWAGNFAHSKMLFWK